MYVRYSQGKNVVVVFGLLSLMAAANTWQGIVLCVGPHGHFALEPAGHTHCPAAADAEDLCRYESDTDHSHCCPCTDIPIPGCSGVYRPAPRMNVADSAAASLPLMATATTDGGYATAPALRAAWTACDISLHSTVLQV